MGSWKNTTGAVVLRRLIGLSRLSSAVPVNRPTAGVDVDHDWHSCALWRLG